MILCLLPPDAFANTLPESEFAEDIVELLGSSSKIAGAFGGAIVNANVAS